MREVWMIIRYLCLGVIGIDTIGQAVRWVLPFRFSRPVSHLMSSRLPLDSHTFAHGSGVFGSNQMPLEYLDASERARQQRVMLALMIDPPVTIERLIALFIDQLG